MDTISSPRDIVYQASNPYTQKCQDKSEIKEHHAAVALDQYTGNQTLTLNDLQERANEANQETFECNLPDDLAVSELIASDEQTLKLMDDAQYCQKEEMRAMLDRFKHLKKKYDIYVIMERSCEISSLTATNQSRLLEVNQLANYNGSEFFASIKGS